MDLNTFTNLVITLMAIIIVLSAIKTVILHFILDRVEEIIELYFWEPGQSDPSIKKNNGNTK